MKILFLSSKHKADYLSDLVLHGLTKTSHEIFAYSLKDFLCDDYPKHRLKNDYGLGFTYSGLISRSRVNLLRLHEIKTKIRASEFDLVIYGEIHRFSKLLFYNILHKQKIAVLDGEDLSYGRLSKSRFLINILITLKGIRLASDFRILLKTKTLFLLNNKCLFFFKRELLDNQNAFPISFAIPIEKINKSRKKRIGCWRLISLE